MDIIIIPALFFVTLFLIFASFAVGFATCNRYHNELNNAKIRAVDDYRAKERALFNLAKDEVDYYNRVIVSKAPEIPLPTDHTNEACWSQTDNSIAFAGEKSQFKRR